MNTRKMEGAEYIDLDDVPGIGSKNIIAMARECPEGKAIRLPAELSGKAVGALLGSISRHTGRRFRLHENAYLVPVATERPAVRKVAKPKAKKAEGPYNVTEHQMSKAYYIKTLVNLINEKKRIRVKKSFFATRLAKTYAVRELRKRGFRVEFSNRTHVPYIEVFYTGSKKRQLVRPDMAAKPKEWFSTRSRMRRTAVAVTAEPVDLPPAGTPIDVQPTTETPQPQETVQNGAAVGAF